MSGAFRCFEDSHWAQNTGKWDGKSGGNEWTTATVTEISRAVWWNPQHARLRIPKSGRVLAWFSQTLSSSAGPFRGSVMSYANVHTSLSMMGIYSKFCGIIKIYTCCARRCDTRTRLYRTPTMDMEVITDDPPHVSSLSSPLPKVRLLLLNLELLKLRLHLSLHKGRGKQARRNANVQTVDHRPT